MQNNTTTKPLNQNNMTPIEKAKELVEKYANTNGVYGASKRCALIAVDEIIQSLQCAQPKSDLGYPGYWHKVKNEIINL